MLEEAIPSIWALVHGWLTPTVLFILVNLVIGTIAVTSKGIRGDAGGGGEPRNLSRAPSLVLDRLRSFNLYRYRSGDVPIESAAGSEPLETLHASPDRAVSDYRSRSGDIPLESAAGSEPLETLHALPDLAVSDYRSRSRSGDIPLESAAGSEPLETVHALPDPAVSEAAEAIHAVSEAAEEHHQFSQIQLDARPTVGEAPVKLAAKMKKSASDESMFAHIEAEEAEVVPRPATVRPRTGRQEPKAEEEEDDAGGEVDARADDFINRFRQQLELQRLDSIVRYKEMLNRGVGNRI
ncbi:pathogen-associated molecular patterns-induced protein A70-like [Phoenix dactylifera]|uniref:Pathogen-associated molecular patterns-induced protein A70-like n=1 Tax=Phoenix dactylifera TaxID=42345 RepID=A0A8B9AJL7_PHODC|nr:pathogen-associated molecular patterns-induced protein A70-like [Phoenix dactylifera]